MRSLPAILSCHTKPMAANWHLGDVGSAADFGIGGRLGQNPMVKIRLASRITVLKGRNGDELARPKPRFCIFWVCHRSTLTKLQLLYVGFILSQLANTFCGGCK